MTIYQLIYTSRATIDMTADVLLNILDKSNKNNPVREISGLLIYKDGQFIQLLEGDKQNVQELFALIKRDPRHSDTAIIHEGFAARRQMPMWAMAFASDAPLNEQLTNQHFFIDLDYARQVCGMIDAGLSSRLLEFLN